MIKRLYTDVRDKVSKVIMGLADDIILRVPVCTCGDISAKGVCRKHPGSYRLMCLEAEQQSMIEKLNEIEERIKELKK